MSYVDWQAGCEDDLIVHGDNNSEPNIPSVKKLELKFFADTPEIRYGPAHIVDLLTSMPNLRDLTFIGGPDLVTDNSAADRAHLSKHDTIRFQMFSSKAAARTLDSLLSTSTLKQIRTLESDVPLLLMMHRDLPSLLPEIVSARTAEPGEALLSSFASLKPTLNLVHIAPSCRKLIVLDLRWITYGLIELCSQLPSRTLGALRIPTLRVWLDYATITPAALAQLPDFARQRIFPTLQVDLDTGLLDFDGDEDVADERKPFYTLELAKAALKAVTDSLQIDQTLSRFLPDLLLRLFLLQ